MGMSPCDGPYDPRIMKRSILLCTLAAALTCVAVLDAAAQEQRLDSSPKVFRAFFAKFLDSVRSNDRSSVAAMTSFPLRYGFDAGDEGTMTRTQFIKRFAEIFGKSPREFLPEKNPLFRHDGSNYTVSTEDAAHLTFRRKGARFYLRSYIVEP